MTEIFRIYFQYIADLKLFHFQTKLYSGHKASDLHFERSLKHLDNLLEVYQGRFGRIRFKHLKNIELINIDSTEQIIDSTNELNTVLKAWSKEYLEDHSGLLNIIDEIIADNDQFLYLLSFT